MINPDTGQVFILSDYFGKLASIIGEYIDFNKGNLGEDERNRLYDAEIELARLAGEINIIGVNLVFEDVAEELGHLEIITESVKKTVKKALAVQRAIDIATGLVTIGTAVVSMDPKAIVKTTADLAKTLEIDIEPGARFNESANTNNTANS